MSDVVFLPLPKFPLTRYNSKVLLGWLERCEVVALDAVTQSKSFPPTSPMEIYLLQLSENATKMRDQVAEVLHGRSYDEDFLNRIITLVREDVNSDVSENR